MIVLGFAEGGGMVQLVPDGTILIHIALILLMIWVLNRTFFRPINRVLESRERNKGGRSGEAHEILQQVGEKSARYDEAMRKARTEGYQIVETERTEAMAKRQTEIESVKEEVSKTISQEKDSIQKQSQEARTTIAAEADKMAEKISSTILRG
jgi:F-type H+-transporting ATPase subunit b